MIKINEQISLAEWELSESFVRASGPGGQHVNKTSSAVELRFEAERSPNLPAHVKTRLRQLAGRRWSKDGALLITAEEHRSQLLNREAALRKLSELINQACQRPKRRIATKPSRNSQRRRMDAKTARGAIKAKRGRVRDDD
ncbi:MAG: alternative ribosome rescue aminoacyl-tRNA hydrolase ArfB [Granulosicoccaceae bacterium]